MEDNRENDIFEKYEGTDMVFCVPSFLKIWKRWERNRFCNRERRKGISELLLIFLWVWSCKILSFL